LRKRAILWVLSLLAAQAEATASVRIARYGATAAGTTVYQYTLRNDRGMTVKFISYGAIITDVDVPDRRRRAANVVLGYATLADYEAKNQKNRFGAVVGRYAGRIANARFTLDGRVVRLRANDGPNALHGGPGPGLDSKVWSVRLLKGGGGPGAVLSCVSADGEQGFPGALRVSATYRLLPDDSLRIDYRAQTRPATVLNPTNHSYFNLAGAGSGTVLGQRLQILAGAYAVTDTGGIPTGRFEPVAGTPLDFHRPTGIGTRIDVRRPPMGERGGYNHAWLLDGPRKGALREAAMLEDPASGRRLEIWTTEPALQVYTGDYIDGQDIGAQGIVYRPRDGVALETQHLSDSPNHPEFPTTVLRPGQIFRSTTIWRFGAGPRAR
jgi:aldose 1-epimerase